MTMTAIGVHENTEIGMHENSENNGNIEIATSVAATSTIVTVMIGTASAQRNSDCQIVPAVIALAGDL